MNNVLSHDITEEQIRKYQEDGAICIRGQFSKKLIGRMLAAGIGHIDNPSGRRGIVDDEDDPGRFVTGTHMSRYNEEFMEFASQRLLGSTLHYNWSTCYRLDGLDLWMAFIRNTASGQPTSDSYFDLEQ